jgi:hypothetical protein
MKLKVAFIVLGIMVVLVLSAGSLTFLNSNATFTESRKMLVMRSIGHELLLSSRDSVSRVLPVRKIDEQNFLLEFENRFAFYPDSLVAIVKRTLAQSEFPVTYAVNVMNCSNRSIVYGYEITTLNTTVPCLGRLQPVDCYAVQITFPKQTSVYGKSYLVALGFIGLTLIGWVTVGWIRKPKSEPVMEVGGIAIGSYQFYPQGSLLTHPVETQELSRRETAVLNILAGSLNQLVPRDRLLKEVWEDEGIITGRSLDVFISKLRKKLRHDDTVKLTNVHGKGYRLEA